jgi:hypothetical protein
MKTEQEKLAECRAHWEATKPDAVFPDYWLGWKAARETLVVELPAPEKSYGMIPDYDDPDLVQDHKSVVEAIESAGIRVEMKS